MSEPTQNQKRDLRYENDGAVRNLHFDRRINALVIAIQQGDYYVSSNPTEVISTILGSCIAVCMRDPLIGCGGMNHFILPEAAPETGDLPGLQLRYGSYSIERLLNAILARGGRRERLEVKVFGGANVTNADTNIGHRNADFVERYCEREGLKIAARQLRGTTPRRIRYYPVAGVVQMSKAGQDIAARLTEQEALLRHDRRLQKIGGVIEIFGSRGRRDE